MKKIVSIVCVIALCLGVLAGCGQKIEAQEETIVKLVWNGTTTEVKTSQWNDKSTQVSTEDASLGGGKVYDFVGVKLSTLMEIAGAGDCTKAIVKSSDGYSAEVAVEDIKAYDITLVTAYASGKLLEEDAGGPLKLVYPITEHPELNDTYDAWSWQWYVCEVEFVK